MRIKTPSDSVRVDQELKRKEKLRNLFRIQLGVDGSLVVNDDGSVITGEAVMDETTGAVASPVVIDKFERRSLISTDDAVIIGRPTKRTG